MKDLNMIYDKYDSKKDSLSQSYISKASSPAKDHKSIVNDRRNQPPTNSAKKRSVSRQKSTL